ncbi:MAG: serine hydrolase domain-containing protein [Asticcacaulis sp.]|uniref:serine hydrolase domain-containing protein n=1 Tax=Asticcacaulis sp. TaxID=1872648 RepID=UPI003F7C8384
MSLKSVQIAVVLFAVCAIPARAADLSADQTARIDAAITGAIHDSGAPSASVAVVKDGQVVYEKAFGEAALSPVLPATPATRYQIASVSKQFTAAAALLLQQQGRLSLDDKVAKWFPQVAEADKISLRQLLTHTSGVSDFWPQDYVQAPMQKPVDPMTVLNTWGTRPLDFQPGADWQYSNTGYLIAGLIIEKVSGQPLFQFVNDNLLKPVGITDAVDISQTDLKTPDALGYERRALAPNRLTPEAGHGWAFGSWYLGLTADDLARWDISILKQSLLSKESYVLQRTPVKLNNGKDSGYAMGLFIGKDGGHALISHDGEGAGYLSLNRIYPDDGVAIVVLTNTMSGDATGNIADSIAYLLLPPTGTDAHMRQVFEGLQTGQVNRADFTDDFNGYLDAATIADYKSTLGPLGAPTAFSLTRTRNRGGMDYRGYRIRAGGKSLSLSIYVAKDGRIEQFLVSPVD